MSRWYPNLTDIRRTPWIPLGTTDKETVNMTDLECEKVTQHNAAVDSEQDRLTSRLNHILSVRQLLGKNLDKRERVFLAVEDAARPFLNALVNQRKITASTKKELTETTVLLNSAVSEQNRLRRLLDTDQQLLKDVSNVARGRLADTEGVRLLDVIRRLSLEHKDMRDKLNTGNVTSEEVHDRAAKSSQLQKDLEEVRKVLTDNPFTRTLAAAKVLKSKATAWEEESGRSAAALQKVRDVLGAGSGYSSVIESAARAASAETVLHKLRGALGAPEGRSLVDYANNLRLRAERADRGFDGWVEATEYDKLIEQKRELIDENQSLMNKLAYAQEAIIKKNEHIDKVTREVEDKCQRISELASHIGGIRAASTALAAKGSEMHELVRQAGNAATRFGK